MKPIRSPKQSRSQKTFEQLLDAAEEILADKGFDEASVQEIAARAGFTVGAFYARFSDKETLLLALEERFRGRLEHLFATLEAKAAVTPGLAERIRFLVTTAVDVYSQNRGSLVVLRQRSSASSEWKARTAALNREIHDALSAYLDPRDKAIRHGAATDAVDVALLMLFSTLREMMLNGVFWPGVIKLDRERIIDELTRVLHVYLSTPDPDAQAPESENR